MKVRRFLVVEETRGSYSFENGLSSFLLTFQGQFLLTIFACCSVRGTWEGTAPVPAQVCQQRGGEVRPERQPRGARHADR